MTNLERIAFYQFLTSLALMAATGFILAVLL